MNDFGSKIYDAAKKAVKEVYDLELAEGQLIIETPQDTKLGDYSTSIAMKLSRTLRRNPMEIAEPLTAKLAELLPECESITAPALSTSSSSRALSLPSSTTLSPPVTITARTSPARASACCSNGSPRTRPATCTAATPATPRGATASAA